MTDPYAAFSDPVDSAPQAAPVVARTPSPPAYNGPSDASAIMPALIAQESGGRAGVLGPQTQWGRAIGRTQMLPATAREMAQKIGVRFDESLLRGTTPEAAAYQDRLGQAYLEQGLQETGNVYDALRYYHGGPDRNLWGPKTERYAREVMARLEGGETAPMTPQREAPATSYDAFSDPVEPASKDDGLKVWDDLAPDARMQLQRGDQVQLPTGEVVTLRGSPFMDEEQRADDRQGGDGVFIREPNASDSIEAFATAASEQVPFLDEAAAATSGVLTGRGYDATREQQMLVRQLLNETNRSDRIAGGVGGAALSLALPGGNLVKGTRAVKAAKVAGLGAGYGGLFGFANTDGGFQDRAIGAGIGATVGGTAGGLFQVAGDGLIASATKAAANPSPARNLSSQGVLLTPGQMIGGAAQTVEDALAGTLPIAGDAINAARRRGLESFDNVATNTAISPIGVNLADTAGRQGVRSADDAISQAYQTALQNVTVAADQPYTAAIAQARRPDNMTPAMRRQLGVVLDNALDRLNQGQITGDVWKQVDSELSAAVRAADTASGSAPEQRILRDRLQEARTAWRDLLGRIDPNALAQVDAADEAFAQYRLVRKASADVASAGRDGNSSPQTLNRAVLQAGGERRAPRGESLLQDLTDNAMKVLPNTVPNSGTALRGAVGGGLLTGAIFEPVTAAMTGAGLLAGATVYSRPVQKLINDVYRATTPGAARRALGELQQQVARTPALGPIVERLSLELGLSQALLQPDRPRGQSATLLPAPPG